jgi:hypothetical protein
MDLGVTTIAGDRVGVLTRGEVRALPVYGPGGYVWLPENGNGVLVVKGGPGGGEQCVSGMLQREAPEGMLPGEIYLFGPCGNSIYLRKNGTVELQGALEINGEPYEPCTCSKEVL